MKTIHELIIVLGWLTCQVVCGIPLDLNLCPPKKVPCQCPAAASSYTFHLSVKQCTRFHKWEPYCDSCSGQSDEDELKMCDNYVNCAECDGGNSRCSKCAPNRYGQWCRSVCQCQNGGTCDDNGKCYCQPGFEGSQCEVACPPPQRPVEGSYHPDAPVYPIGSSLTFRCSRGFHLSGASVVQCLQNARWSQDSPQCVRACSAPVSPSNGNADSKDGVFVSGTVVQYRCNRGFRLAGSATSSECQEDGTWSGTLPKCVPLISCEPIAAPQNSVATNPEREDEEGPVPPGTSLSFACADGFVLFGSARLTCENNGQWSHQPPLCLPQGQVCSDPGSLLNGDVKVESGKREGDVFQTATQISFSCETLHYLVGANGATCGGDGKWSAPLPICAKITTCRPPEAMPNVLYEIYKRDASSRSANVTTVVRPNSSDARRRIGGSTGGVRFRSATPKTERVSSSPVVPRNIPLPANHFHVDTEAKFECESQYYTLQGSRTRVCTANGQWSGRPPTCIPKCGRSSDPRTPSVTHGTPSNVGQWPWQVGVARLDDAGEWFLICGASLIDEQWLVTAAHCVTYTDMREKVPTDEFRFYVGKYYRDDSRDDNLVQVRQTDMIHIHPDYNPFDFESDIALVHLSSPVVFTSRVQPVCLPKDNSDESERRLRPGNKGVLIGWGEMENGNYSDILKHTSVPVLSNDECISAYKQADLNMRITWNMFCAGYAEGKHDSCTGDSGGPLVFAGDEKADWWVLEGIVSWGSKFGCGRKNEYSGYTRVQRFLDWIHQFI